jgi:NTE family protein
MATSIKGKEQRGNGATKHAPALPGQVVLVMQGGGALGAYQVGVYQALHEAGIEPDWVIGTSIGAINGALIAGNPPDRRLEALHEFWGRVEQRAGTNGFDAIPALATALAHITTMTKLG